VRRRGSILKRCSHPRSGWSKCRHGWTVVVNVIDGDGHRKQVWRAVPAGDDPETVLTTLLREHDQGHLVAETRPQTVREYFDGTWVPHMRTRIRESTLTRYLTLIDADITPVIGEVRVARLRPSDVQRVVDRMVERGLSARTVVQGYRVLSSALAQAVRWELIPTNPAKAVRPPRIERAELTVPEPEQVRAIMKASEGTWLHLPVVLAASTGMRRGEVLALRWRDVDLDAGLIRVTGSLQRIGGKQKVVEPKTSRGRRTVAIPPGVVEQMRAHRKEQTERRLLLGKSWTDLDLVIEQGDGTPRDPDTITHRFQDFCDAAGVSGVRFHDLRHSYATGLLRANIHPKVVSEALGHSSTAFTMDTYSHVLPTMQDQAAEAIGKALALQ
jgi:integrase